MYEIDLTDVADIKPGEFKDEHEKTKQVFYINKKATINSVAREL